MKTNTTIHRMEWNGITVEIAWCPSWSKSYKAIHGHPLAHLEIRAIDPLDEPLPITATGYRSHFCAPADVETYGGPASYVRAWLDEVAISPQWRARQEAMRQLSLL